MSKENIANETEPAAETKEQEPMGILLSRAKADITVAILQIQNSYGLPAYLTDLIVTASLADIRDCANKDLINIMDK